MINSSSPVIIIGMHRSGTTLLANIFHEYGIFMGSQMEQNSEAIGFLKINEYLLKKNNASWFNPVPYLNEKNYQQELQYTKNKLKNKGFKKKYFGDKVNENCNEYHWGWKDPRNTFTLNIWEKIFPNAKIVHIYRNPIDVANSLMVREKKFTKKGMLKWYFNVLKNYCKSGLYVQRSEELSDIKVGINLWKNYLEKAFSINKNIIHMKYEDLLSHPELELKKIFEFLNIDCDNVRLKEIIKNIDGKRKYAFISNEILRKVYKGIQKDSMIKRLGYDEIIL